MKFAQLKWLLKEREEEEEEIQAKMDENIFGNFRNRAGNLRSRDRDSKEKGLRVRK